MKGETFIKFADVDVTSLIKF